MKFFYSMLSAAKLIGVSRRHLSKIAEQVGVRPLVFTGTSLNSHFYTRPQIERIRKSRIA